MYSFVAEPIILEPYKKPLQRLVRSVHLARGDFAVILVKTPNPALSEQILATLNQAIAPMTVKQLYLHPQVTDICGTIHQSYLKQHSQSLSPQVISLHGLTRLNHPEQALRRMNMARDQFQAHHHFPMIWWIDDRFTQRLNRYAPDFRSCLTAPIIFPAIALPPQLQQTSEHHYSTVL